MTPKTSIACNNAAKVLRCVQSFRFPVYIRAPDPPFLRGIEFQSSFPEPPRVDVESNAYLVAQKIVHAHDAIYLVRNYVVGVLA